MDDTDRGILRHLMVDGRKSNGEIAKAMGVVEETVRRRRASLQRDGAYELVAIPDYRKFGYEVELLLGNEADPSQIDEVAEALNELNEVYRVSCTTGSFNIFAWLMLRSIGRGRCASMARLPLRTNPSWRCSSTSIFQLFRLSR